MPKPYPKQTGSFCSLPRSGGPCDWSIACAHVQINAVVCIYIYIYVLALLHLDVSNGGVQFQMFNNTFDGHGAGHGRGRHYFFQAPGG